MANGFERIIVSQVSFCDIGFMHSIVHEHSIPWPVFWWPTKCYLFIPFITILKNRINIYDHAPIIKQFMLDYLPNIEFRINGTHLNVSALH